jgi:hypothetical protein
MNPQPEKHIIVRVDPYSNVTGLGTTAGGAFADIEMAERRAELLREMYPGSQFFVLAIKATSRRGGIKSDV